MAISHDWAESHTGDITIAVKREFPNIGRAVNSATLVVQASYSPIVFDTLYDLNNGYSPESLIVNMADIIQCMQYSAHEIKLGNTGYMTDVYKESVIRLSTVQEKLNEYEK